VRRFRVISQFNPEADVVFAALEDCLTLELRPYAAADLWEMRLRLVRPLSNCPAERPIR